jgi:hypothetical protein
MFLVELVDGLQPLRDPELRAGERELDELDSEACPVGSLHGGPVARGVDGRGDDSDPRPAGGEDARQVHHGDDVALRHQRHQKEV